MEAGDGKAAPLDVVADADATLSAAVTEAVVAIDRDRENTGLAEVQRIMAEIRSGKPK